MSRRGPDLETIVSTDNERSSSGSVLGSRPVVDVLHILRMTVETSHAGANGSP